MTVPKIKQPAKQAGPSAEDPENNAEGILPLTVEFQRDAVEQIAVMFEATNLINRSGRRPMTSLASILILLAVFLAALLALQMADRFDVKAAFLGPVLAAVGVTALLMGLWAAFYQSRLMRKFQSQLRDGAVCRVEINEDGVRSSTAAVVLASDWNNVRDIAVSKKCLLLTDEVWVHYVPARALATGLSLSKLEGECKRRKRLADGDPS